MTSLYTLTTSRDLHIHRVYPVCLPCKLYQIKQGPALFFNNSRTVAAQHDNTGIHANSWFPDQSTQMTSWKLAYCWIIHSFHQAGKKAQWALASLRSFFFSCLCLCCKTIVKKKKKKKVTRPHLGLKTFWMQLCFHAWISPGAIFSTK